MSTRFGQRPKRGASFGALVIVALWCAALSSCSGGDERAIRAILNDDREAHFKLDATALASNLADTLISVDRGTVNKQARDDVEAFFRAYFRDVFYRTWDDVEDPLVRIAPGGKMAWVVRKVRVDRDEPALGGDKARRQFVSAWTSTYEKAEGRWKMTTVTSTFVPDPSRAERIVAAGRRHLGGPAPRGIRARARVQGPESRFEVTVHSAYDGRVRIDFSSGLSAAIGRDVRWVRRSPASEPSALSPAMETFVRGHEVHMNALAPATRYGPLQAAGPARFAGLPALKMTGFDALEGIVEFFYAQVDSTPLGLRVDDRLSSRGTVNTELDEWRPIDGLRLPHRAVFRQRDEVFTYDFVEIAVDPELPDSLFARPAS